MLIMPLGSERSAGGRDIRELRLAKKPSVSFTEDQRLRWESKEILRQWKELEKIADDYVVASKFLGDKTLAFTKANDRLLRLFLRQNLIRDKDSSDVFFATLGKNISARLHRDNLAEENAEKSRQLRVRSSIEQLVRYILFSRNENNNLFFATSPELDADHGVDLFECAPVWMPDSARLEVDMTVFQAKAGGRSPKEVEKLIEEYRPKGEYFVRTFELNPKWFFDLAAEEIERRSQISDDQRSKIVSGGVLGDSDSLLIGEKAEEIFALRQFCSYVAAYLIFENLGRQEEIHEASVVLRSVKYRLLVNNKKAERGLLLAEKIFSRTIES